MIDFTEILYFSFETAATAEILVFVSSGAHNIADVFRIDCVNRANSFSQFEWLP